jgi:hypothetical protein
MHFLRSNSCAKETTLSISLCNRIIASNANVIVKKGSQPSERFTGFDSFIKKIMGTQKW